MMRSHYYIFVALVLGMYSCKKNKGPIEYPLTGAHGINVLNGSDTLFLSGSSYSFAATVPKGNALKIELNHISGVEWGYNIATVTNWNISTYSNGNQIFEITDEGNADLEFVKFGALPDTGTISMDYYENGSVITKHKILVWQ